MSELSKLDSKVGSFISSKRGKGGKGNVVQLHMTDLAKDLELLHNNLLKKVCPTAVGYAASIVRKRAVANIKAVSSTTETHIGMSRKTGSRKKWSKKILDKRGANFPSLADTGMIIKKNISRKEGGLVASQIVGPKYQAGEGKNFAHTHEPRADQSSGAPNHKWWGKPAREPLKKRPFLGEAAKQTMNQQVEAIYKALKHWKTKMGEVNGTTGEF